MLPLIQLFGTEEGAGGRVCLCVWGKCIEVPKRAMVLDLCDASAQKGFLLMRCTLCCWIGCHAPIPIRRKGESGERQRDRVKGREKEGGMTSWGGPHHFLGRKIHVRRSAHVRDKLPLQLRVQNPA